MPTVPNLNVEQRGILTLIELARPATGNALSAELISDLGNALASLPPRARAVVLTGRGRHFCTGADLGELAATIDAPVEEHEAEAARLAAVYAQLLRCPLLTIAAVRGAAYGGGAGLAAGCDVVVAAPEARFQFSEVRLGFVPALISTFLSRRVMPAVLARAFLDPAPLDAVAAQAIGLVDEVTDDPLGRAVERATEIGRKTAPSALAETKRLLLAAALPHLDDNLAAAVRANASQRVHPDCRRGVAAFLASHSFPDWLKEEA
jgi:methylglutaconyl-CoA hydratase